MNRQIHKSVAQRQTGAALMVSLMILLVLTLIGITSMSTTILEEKMAGGVRNQNLSFQAAEAALRDGEIWIKAQNTVVTLGIPVDLSAQNDAWWSSNAHEYGVAGTQEITEVSADPRYVVEQREAVDSSGSFAVGQKTNTSVNIYYRLTARGTGGNTAIETILQSHYMVKAN